MRLQAAWAVCRESFDAVRRKPRFWVAAAIAGSGAFTTAILGLVLEDIFPSAGNHWSPTLSRFLLLGLALVLLLASLAAHRVLNDNFGEVLYISALLPSMGDQHAPRLLMRQFAEVRETSGELSSDYDWVDEVNLVGQAANAVVANRKGDSGLHLAPNLLWPAAMGVGADVALHHGCELLELDRVALSGSADVPLFNTRWQPESTRRVYRAGVTTRWEARTSDSDKDGLTVILAFLTESRDLSTPGRWRIERIGRVALFDDDGRPEPVRIRAESASSAATAGPGSSGAAFVHPHEAVTSLLATIKAAMRDAPGHPVLLAAQLSKIVAFHLGTSSKGQAFDIWKNLVPLHWNEAEHDYQPVRVHDSQGSMAEMLERLKKYERASTP